MNLPGSPRQLTNFQASNLLLMAIFYQEKIVFWKILINIFSHLPLRFKSVILQDSRMFFLDFGKRKLEYYRTCFVKCKFQRVPGFPEPVEHLSYTFKFWEK